MSYENHHSDLLEVYKISEWKCHSFNHQNPLQAMMGVEILESVTDPGPPEPKTQETLIEKYLRNQFENYISPAK